VDVLDRFEVRKLRESLVLGNLQVVAVGITTSLAERLSRLGRHSVAARMTTVDRIIGAKWSTHLLSLHVLV